MSSKFRSIRYDKRSTVLFLVLLALLAGCDGPLQEPIDVAESPSAPSRETALEVPFETVERAAYSWSTGEFWEAHAPGVAIINDPLEVERLNTFISPDAESKLHALDYDTQFALAAFMGIQGCAHNDFRIEQVLLRRKELEVYSYGQGYDPERACAPTKTSPYHIIALARAGVWEEAERFTLYINDEHAVTGSYPPVVSQATPAPTATQESIPVPTPWPTVTPPPP